MKYEEELLRPNAVFPELPKPLEHVGVKIKDLNSNIEPISEYAKWNIEEDNPAKPAIEVGIRFRF